MNPKGERWAVDKKEHWDALANEKINLLENAFQEHINWICQYAMQKKTTESSKRRLSQNSTLEKSLAINNTSEDYVNHESSNTSPTLPLAKRQCIDLRDSNQASLKYEGSPETDPDDTEKSVSNISQDIQKDFVKNDTKNERISSKINTSDESERVLLIQKSRISTGITKLLRRNDGLDENDTVKLLVPSKSKSTPIKLEGSLQDSISMRSLSFGRGFNHARSSLTDPKSFTKTENAVQMKKPDTILPQLNTQQNHPLNPTKANIEANTSTELMPPPKSTIPLKFQFADIPSENQATLVVESIERIENKRERTTNESISTATTQEFDDEFLDILDVTPDWVKSPMFEQLLEKQTHMDPDKIFGRIPPIDLKNIFTKPRKTKH
ncbi:hypothetical protein F4703DRAFT_1840718 [Phycomyces blakesleeanus]